ncbi:MAG: Flp pilus assembly complex ATPase component TadA [Anaerolineae bacterium]|nr:Flp pilus assembly complex ATPase component TadA [Anaerolineae bacterium]
MSEEPNHDYQDEWADLKRDADKGREPDLLSGRFGQRMVSVRALLEQISQAFREEFADTPMLREAQTSTQRLKLLLETVNYVLSVESIQLTAPEKADLVARAYSDIFGYGRLDAYFADENVTTITLDGPDKAAVRYGHGDLVPVGPLFEDEGDLRRILRRLVVDAGADLPDDQPYIETGLMVGDRPVCVNLLAPPVTFQLNADIRVHPAQQPTLDALVEQGFLSPQAAEILSALAQSPHGLVIVGDTESGKTTLLSALVQLLPTPAQTIAIERAGELRLPADMRRLVARWPVGDQPEVTFGEQIGNALAQEPGCILLDEVRADEPQSIAPLLSEDHAPRQIWSFRGPFDSKRLRSALSMLARRSDVGSGEQLVNALYHRLPFVVTVWRAWGQIQLYSIAEWQFATDYPDYVTLLETQDGHHVLTGKQPIHTLDLPDDFWSV